MLVLAVVHGAVGGDAAANGRGGAGAVVVEARGCRGVRWRWWCRH